MAPVSAECQQVFPVPLGEVAMSLFRVNVYVLSALVIMSPANSYAQNRGLGKDFATRSVAMATNGMAATSQPLATAAALQILMKGGHAVDAAIAANAVLGLVEPNSNGIGGDFFVIIWDNDNKQIQGFNGSGRSPRALTLQEFRERGLKTIPNIGPLSVSVTGAVDGWFQVHE